MENATEPGPSPEPRTEWGITTILVPLAVLALVAYAATRWGWVGLVAGVLLAPVLVFVSIGLLGLVVMGLCFLFHREEFDRIAGKTPAEDPDGPPYPGPSETTDIADTPVPRRRGRFRIRTLLIVTLVLALWLGVGLAMVRASKTQRQKEEAVLIVVLVPLGMVANHFAQRWGEHFFLKEKNASEGEPPKP